MTVERLFAWPSGGGSQAEHTTLQLVAATGVVGDRYFGKNDEPGQNITFVEAEHIEAFALAAACPMNYAATRRNVVTRGVRLNELVGREFSVGGLRFRGVDLCEPCHGLGTALATPELAMAGVVNFFVHKGGLRADVLSTGALQVGAAFDAA